MISESTNRADSTDGYGAIFKRAAETRRLTLREDLAEARRAGDNAAATIAGYKLEALRWPQDFGPRQVHDHFERLARGRHQFTSDTRHPWLEERENGL